MRSARASDLNPLGRAVRVVLRVSAAGLLTVAVFGSMGSVDRSLAGAQGGTVLFDLSARADGLGLEFIGTGFPVVPQGKVAFLSPASAQSTLNQFSGSAFASSPYPGDLIVSLPTTVNGLGAGSVPAFPAYPFYVATDSSTTDKREEVGPYLIAAHTDENLSSGDARVGLSTFSPEVVSVTAHAEVTKDPDTGALAATATTRTAPVRVNDLLSIGEIRSTATFRFDPSTPDVAPVKESTVSVGTITIAGIELGLTEKGLSVAGTQLLPVDTSALTRMLAGSGFNLELIPAVETDTSVTSAAVQLTFQKELPAPFLDTTVRLVLGRSSATLAASMLQLPSLPFTPSPPLAGALAGPLDSGLGSAVASPTVMPTVTPPTQGPVADRPAVISAPLADLSRFYPVLAIAALLALASSRIVQWSAFRTRLAPVGPSS